MFFLINSCADAEAPGECSDKDKELAKTDDYCGYLLSDSSPFKICRDSKKVDFTKMYSSCEFDVCSSDKNNANCQTLESTALACSQHGYRVKWRSLNFCRKFSLIFRNSLTNYFMLARQNVVNGLTYINFYSYVKKRRHI